MVTANCQTSPAGRTAHFSKSGPFLRFWHSLHDYSHGDGFSRLSRVSSVSPFESCLLGSDPCLPHPRGCPASTPFSALCAHLTRIAPVPRPIPSADYLFFSTAQTAGLGLSSLAHPACCLSSLPGFQLWFLLKMSHSFLFPLSPLSFHFLPK